METTAELKTRAGSGAVWLEVHYGGLTPPGALFADLTMIGWTPPPIAPPPRSAIDWDTPDEATGERFTINDYAVTDQAVEPPRGSGPRGGWTEAERAVFMRTLEGVLRRHGLLAAPAPPPPPSPAASPAPTTSASPAPVPATGDRRVELDLDPTLAVPAATLLTSAGVLANVQVVERRREQVFRGSRRVEAIPRLAVTFSAPDAQAAELTARLQALEPTPTGAGPLHDPASATPAPAPTWGRSMLAVTVERSRQPLLAEGLAALGLEPVSTEPTTVTTTTSFRGSVSREQRPALRVTLDVPTTLVDQVVAALVDAGLVPRDGLDRVEVTVGTTDPVGTVASPERPPPRPLPVEPLGLVSRR